jgi:hypothetical protein
MQVLESRRVLSRLPASRARRGSRRRAVAACTVNRGKGPAKRTAAAQHCQANQAEMSIDADSIRPRPGRHVALKLFGRMAGAPRPGALSRLPSFRPSFMASFLPSSSGLTGPLPFAHWPGHRGSLGVSLQAVSGTIVPRTETVSLRPDGSINGCTR